MGHIENHKLMHELRRCGYQVGTGKNKHFNFNTKKPGYQTTMIPSNEFNQIMGELDTGMYCVMTGKFYNGSDYTLAIIDVDSKNLYDTYFSQYENVTVSVATPSGGRHLWFLTKDKTKSENGYKNYKLDLKAWGGIIVIPPSKSDKGEYKFINKNDLKPMKINNIDEILGILPEITKIRSQFIDFYDRMAEVGYNIINLLGDLGVKDIESKDHKVSQMYCPWKIHTQQTKKVDIFIDSHNLYCYGCSKGMDIVDIVMFYQKFEKKIDAIKWLEDKTNIKSNINFNIDDDEYPKETLFTNQQTEKMTGVIIKNILKRSYKPRFKRTVDELNGLYQSKISEMSSEDISIKNKQCKALQMVWDWCLLNPKMPTDVDGVKITPKMIIEQMEESWYFCYDEIMRLPLMVQGGISIDFTDKIAQKIDTYCTDVHNIPTPFASQIKNVLLDRCENNRLKTYIRTAYINDVCYYKLNDIDMVIIDKNGWKIVENKNDLVFRDVGIYPQVKPKRGKTKLYDLFEKSRLNKYEKILYMGAHVAAIIESIDHPIININGEHGTGKTGEAKNVISTVDPDGNSELNLWDGRENFVMAIEKKIAMGLDNLSYISMEESNLFCMVSTGGAIEKRVHYANTKTLKVPFRSTLIITSIYNVLKEPDVLDRCINLNIIKEDKERGSFKFDPKVIPYKIGCIFDCLSYYLSVKDEYEKTIISPIRLDNYYYVTLATAVNNGFTKKDVDEAFEFNTIKNLNQLIDGSKVATYMMDNISKDSPFEGKADDLNELIGITSGGNKPYNNGSTLSRNLNKVLPALKYYGFEKIELDSRRAFKIVKNQVFNSGFDGELADW